MRQSKVRSEGRGKWRGRQTTADKWQPAADEGKPVPSAALWWADSNFSPHWCTTPLPLCLHLSLTHVLYPPFLICFYVCYTSPCHPRLFRSMLTYTNSALIKLTYSCLLVLRSVKTVHRVPDAGGNMLTAACGRQRYKTEVGQSNILAG